MQIDPQNMILNLIAISSEGLSIEELGQQVNLSKRTLQRRLASFITKGVVKKIGRGRSTRYRANENLPKIITKNSLSWHESQKIQEPVKPHVREPILYNPNFLEVYIPGKTFYLPLSVRDHLAAIGRPQQSMLPAGTYAKHLLSRLIIDLSWNSSRLEGNTYSLLQTERLLQNGIAADNKTPQETQMILNHKAAIEFLVEMVAEIGFNRYTLLNLHALLSENLLEDPTACGRLRSIPVGITHSVYIPPSIPQQIELYFDQILERVSQIQNPFESAFFEMVHLPYLQPFEDVNKRVSRLAANIPLITHNFCPLSFVDVPEQEYINAMLDIYEHNRIDALKDVFVGAYERSCARYSQIQRSLGEPDPFRMTYREEIKKSVREVVVQTMDKKKADSYIYERARRDIVEKDQSRFIEIVETEIMSLHDGNIARYSLRPSEFTRWHANWK